MQKRVIQKFLKTMALVLNFQLAFSPMALAMDQRSSNYTSNDETRWAQVGQGAAMFSELMMQAASAYQQGAAGAQGGPNQVAAIEAQLSPMLKLQPIDQRQVPPVFGNCLVLPANGATLTGSMSCQGAGDDQMIAGYGDAIISIAEFNKKQLENFTTKGHERFTTQGVGCYEKRLEDFSGLLKAREEELAKLKNNLQQRLEAFKLASKNDLEAIKTGTALLTGKPEKYIKDYKFQDQLFGKVNDPNNVCASVMSQDAVQRAGSKGFRGIEEEIFKAMNNKQNGAYTAEEMLSKSNQIKSDVNKLADKIAAQMQRRNSNSFGAGDLTGISFRGKEIGKSSKAIQSVLGEFDSERKAELATMQKELDLNQATQGNDQLASIRAGIEGDSINLEERLAFYERRTQQKCLQDVIKSNFKSPASFARKFRNPNVSKDMNDNADNAFATEIVSLINADNVSLDYILNEIKRAEGAGLNSQRVMRTGKSFSVEGKVVNASTPLRASQMVDIFATNCKNQYKYQKNADGFTNSQIVAKLRSYKAKLNSFRKISASKVKSLLKDRILNCSDDNSTGTAALSCSGAMNKNSDNFCVRTAQKCASNFKGCYAKAERIKKETKDKRDATAIKYNTEVEQLKTGMRTELAAINNFMEAQARSLDAQLNMGTVFNVPAIQFDFSGELGFTGQDAQGIPAELNMQDPAKILEQANRQIDALTQQLAKQRDEQMMKLNKVKDDYASNYSSQASYWNDVINQCNGRIAQTQQMLNEQANKVAEDNEKIRKACLELQAFNGDPCATDNISDLMTTVQEASVLAAATERPGPGPSRGLASTNIALRQLQQMKGTCDRLDDPNQVRTNISRAQVNTYCAQIERRGTQGTSSNDSASTCKKYNRAVKEYNGKSCTETEFIGKLERQLASGQIYCKFSDSGTEKVQRLSEADCATKSGSKIEVKESNLRSIINKWDQDDLPSLAGCFIEDSPYFSEIDDAYTDAYQLALTSINIEDSNSQVGEQQVSLAMCNGGYGGQFDQYGFGSLLQEGAQAFGAYNSLRE